MRVDNSDHGKHDHGFGLGAHDPELEEVSLPIEQTGNEPDVGHGLFDALGHGADASAPALGGHVEVGHLGNDFGHDGLHEGLDGLHDSVSHSVGLGFEGDEHHSLHDALHESLHEPQHVAHDAQHVVAHDQQHHETGLGDLFHH